MITVHHSCHNLTQCIQIFRETGSVDRKKGSGLPTKRTEEAIANVNKLWKKSHELLSVDFHNKFNCQPVLVTTF
jgi:hypothetical protein